MSPEPEPTFDQQWSDAVARDVDRQAKPVPAPSGVVQKSLLLAMFPTGEGWLKWRASLRRTSQDNESSGLETESSRDAGEPAACTAEEIALMGAPGT